MTPPQYGDEAWERLNQQIGRLEGSIDNAYKLRRKTILMLIGLYVLSVYTAITLHDEHVRKCMIAGVDHRSEWCGRLFPLHSHEDIERQQREYIERLIKENL